LNKVVPEPGLKKAFPSELKKAVKNLIKALPGFENEFDYFMAEYKKYKTKLRKINVTTVEREKDAVLIEILKRELKTSS
jgi:hypothetical protein